MTAVTPNVYGFVALLEAYVVTSIAAVCASSCVKMLDGDSKGTKQNRRDASKLSVMLIPTASERNFM
jgi:hypothetical protein